jgi:hypothetical protein
MTDEQRAAVIAAMDDAFDKATVDSGYWDWHTVLGRMADAAIAVIDAGKPANDDSVTEPTP